MNGPGSRGTTKKLTEQTHGIKSGRERLKIEEETEVEISPPLCLVNLCVPSAYAARRVFLRSPSSFDNKVSRKTKGKKTKYYEVKRKTLNSV